MSNALIWNKRPCGLLPWQATAKESRRISYLDGYWDWHRGECQFMWFIMFRDQQPMPRPWPDLLDDA